MATLPLLLSAYLSKPSNVIYVSKVYYYDKNLNLTQNMPGNLSFSENDFLLNSGLMTVYNNLINYINLINPTDIPVYSPLSSFQYGDYFINPSANNFQPTQIIQDLSSSNINNSKIINFVATVDSADLNFGTVKPDYTNILTNINNNLSSLVSKNNQSEITAMLREIFEIQSYSDPNKYYSTMKMEVSDGDHYRKNINIPNLLKMIVNVLMTGATYDYNLNQFQLYDTGKSLSRIQKVFDYSIPTAHEFSMNYYLSEINNKLSETLSNVEVPFLKEIALAITSLASANDNQAIKALKDTISALELKVENNNVLLIDGQQDFCIKDYKELDPNSD